MNLLTRVTAMLSLASLLGGGACAKGGPPWQDYARGAQLLGPTQIQDAASGLAALNSGQRELVHSLLAELIALPPGVDAVRQAGKKVDLTLPKLVDPKSDIGGLDPAVSAAMDAVICVLHGLVYRSGQAAAALPDKDKAALELLNAVRQDLAVFPEGSSGQTSAPPELERELRLGLGPELYLAAVRAAG